MAKHRNWTREEVWAALALYLKTEFGRIHKHNPEIISLSEKIQRTPSSVALKLSNLAALDETLDRMGMKNASKMDRRVWSEWKDDPNLILEINDNSIWLGQEPTPNKNEPLQYGFREGQDKFVQTTRRVGQSVFRDMILSSYRNKCALTGIDEPKLLTASHIVGWAESKKSRLDPCNGICLNGLHDKAFDRHLISFDSSYRMLISRKVSEYSREKLIDTSSLELQLPDKFLPNQDYLEQHRRKFYNTQACY